VDAAELSQSTQDAMKHLPRSACESLKLISATRDKLKYIVHVEQLKYMINAGLILKRIHRVLAFRHEAIFKSYIDSLVERRRAAHSSQKKSALKYLLNSSYGGFELSFMFKLYKFNFINELLGKLIENPEKYRRLKLTRSWNKTRAAFNSCHYVKHTIIGDGLVLFHLKQETLKFRSAILCGVATLEFSKVRFNCIIL